MYVRLIQAFANIDDEEERAAAGAGAYTRPLFGST
jgi:hypothetical protein